MLRGRCRACGTPISWRYPFVEGLTGLLFAALAALDGPSALLALHLLFVAALVLVSDIDMEHRIIPDVVILPTALIGIVGMTLLNPGGGPRWQWLAAGLGAAGFLLAAGSSTSGCAASRAWAWATSSSPCAWGSSLGRR